MMDLRVAEAKKNRRAAEGAKTDEPRAIGLLFAFVLANTEEQYKYNLPSSWLLSAIINSPPIGNLLFCCSHLSI